MSSRFHQLTQLGQSLWYDTISRRLLESGVLAGMIARGEIRGVTSNPTIFQQAIAKSNDYDSALVPMAWAGWDAERIFWQLAVEDIRAACDLFRPLYDETGGGDGYVSLEVDPRLAHDTDTTLSEARRLWAAVGRPNLMIKIPATLEGLPAIRQAIAAGINVNITLIFSLERYRAVMDAYLSGLEDRLAAGQPVVSIASVASFFVSRMDTKVDKYLGDRAPQLLGKSAVANARLAYHEYRGVFEGPRFAALQARGARIQRPLWASTGTKNPAYSDTVYVDQLIGPNTVNTVPPQTLTAFGDHGTPRLTIEEGLEDASRVLAEVEKLGISIERVTQELEDEGVKAFADAFDALMEAIEGCRQAAVADLGPLADAVAQRVACLEAEAVPARLWKLDPTLWSDDPAAHKAIVERLGWLNLPATNLNPDVAPEKLQAFAAEMQSAGFDHALLLGMGGSSLAPEVMNLVFAACGEKLAVDFAILDSTDPAQVIATAQHFPVERTLFIVSSKSGGTAEVRAAFDYFWERVATTLGKEKVGRHFVAITDPGTDLFHMAQQLGFGHIFLGEPTVGGRFSALSPFGLVPAALMGIDLARFLHNAATLMQQCDAAVPAARNPGLVLGAILGEAALQKCDKLTLWADPHFASLASWLEQLIAESSGKNGVGIIPVDPEPPAAPALCGADDPRPETAFHPQDERYSPDRLFVYFRHSGEHDVAIQRLRETGFPVLTLPVSGAYDLGGEFYRWEFATAVACSILGVNAFDQPDVQDSKDRTKAKIAAFHTQGTLAEGEFITPGADLSSALRAFLQQAAPGYYLALNAYLPRSPHISALLRRLRIAVQLLTGCATTVGFGPRFLHSTGQLHKGGPGKALFLQITADAVEDVTIPEENMTFQTLERAQSLGDFEALKARGRRVLRVHLGKPADLVKLVEAVESLVR